MAGEIFQHSSSTERRKSSDWSGVTSDLLGSILKLLPGVDVLRCKAVCSSWNSVVQSPMASRSMLWLMLGPKERDADNDNTTLCFFNISEQKTYKFKNAIPEELGECYCVGSSRDWLVLLDERARPCLVPKPFLQKQHQTIQLPALRKTFALNVREQTDGSYMVTQRKVQFGKFYEKYYWYRYASVKNLRENFIHKAVLWSNPSSSDNYGVLVIYGERSQLAFFMSGSQTWKDLYGDFKSYSDIVCCNNQLYALSFDTVQVWDLEKSFSIKEAYIGSITNIGHRIHLVESAGEVLSVDCFWEKRDGRGERQLEPCNLFRSSKRVYFHVYKLDFDDEHYFPLVESLGDQTLFIGGRHSFSLSAQDVCCKENSIYLADAYCDRGDRSYFYGGFDVCVFNLKEGTTKRICQSDDSLRIGRRSPFWT